MANVADISEVELFDTVLNTPGLVLVDFYGDDCVKCEAVARILDQLAPELDDTLLIKKVYLTGPDSEAAARFELRGIPTLILFKDGQPVERRSGALNRQDILDAFVSQVRTK